MVAKSRSKIVKREWKRSHSKESLRGWAASMLMDAETWPDFSRTIPVIREWIAAKKAS